VSRIGAGPLMIQREMTMRTLALETLKIVVGTLVPWPQFLQKLIPLGRGQHFETGNVFTQHQYHVVELRSGEHRPVILCDDGN
jgi:hypothetical protein